jgi:hypothetical protein
MERMPRGITAATAAVEVGKNNDDNKYFIQKKEPKDLQHDLDFPYHVR